MENCLFCKIIKGEIPSSKVYEDDEMLIFKDIAPQAKIHYLLVLKEHFANICEMTDEQAVTLARCLKKLSGMVDELGLQGGFRLVSNKGADACQSVEHLHIHILGGEKLSEKMA
ncbi:diadenosine tetraphosphate (Ap4A) hydrolase and other HIT family hydrolases [Acidaminococcus sp. CAG:917]|nr:diadenosine tetraphosphate (Ap4A) hydrolase and other HIT family hydrolases [Acidaminococcus sp. CAG:917]